MQTATNQKTGETVVRIGNEWKPFSKTATNNSGTKAYLVGDQWVENEAQDDGGPGSASRIADLEANLPSLGDTREKLGLGREELTPAEAIAGHPATRFAVGAGRSMLGGGQYITNMLGSDEAAQVINRDATTLKDAQEKGRAAYQRGELQSGIPEIVGAPVDAVSALLKFAGVPGQDKPFGGSESIKKADFDIAGTAGAVLDPAMLGLSKAIPVSASRTGKILQGGGFGATAGTVAPVTDVSTKEDYFKQKEEQQAFGGLLGLGTSGLVEVGKFALDVGRRLVAPVSEVGRQGILRRYYENLLGDKRENIDEVVNAAKNNKAINPGSEPTLAQATSSSPKSTGIAAFESKIGKAEGNSPDFSQRMHDQQTAREKVVAAIAGTKDQRTALKAEAKAFMEGDARKIPLANAGILKIDKILSGVKYMRSSQDYEGREFTEKALDTFTKRLKEIANPDGSVNPNKLYGLRKDLGDQIEKLVKETSTSDRRMTGGLQNEIQSKIDDAIESAGGAGWKDYLSKASDYFSRINQQKAGVLIEKGLKGGASANALSNRADRVLDKYGRDVTPENRAAIDRVVSEMTRNDRTNKLAGQTSLGSAIEKGREGLPELPRILQREYTIGNWLLKLFGQDAERKITMEAMKYHMKPDEFVKLMGQSSQSKVDEMMSAMGADPKALAIMSRAARYGTAPTLIMENK